MAPRSVTGQDLTRVRGVSDPQISADGTCVAFVVTTASEERDEYLSNIWVVDAAGGEPRRFTTGSTRDTVPQWSPDGRRLAFLSDRAARKKAQLHVMPAGTLRLAAGRREAVAVSETLDRSVWDMTPPAWSPDGEWIIFVGRDHGTYPLYRVRAKGGDVPTTIVAGSRCVLGLLRRARDGRRRVCRE